MHEGDVAGRIELFVRDQFRVRPSDTRFSRDADLFDGGYVDSVGVAEMIAFLESEWGVEPSDDDLFSDEFASINGIASIVSRLSVPQLTDSGGGR